MVEDLSKKGKLKNCIAICDVSESMTWYINERMQDIDDDKPPKVCIALGLLLSESCVKILGMSRLKESVFCVYVDGKTRNAPRIMPCRWNLPNANVTKVNTYGAAKNNPREAGVGAVGRNSNELGTSNSYRCGGRPLWVNGRYQTKSTIGTVVLTMSNHHNQISIRTIFCEEDRSRQPSGFRGGRAVV
ncbi:hypothetical protein IFM89_029602 [Coptis chinensis]|uniref:Uncharacterized protein n=1 Tax=Coptis chinensis TaxID=261450 RepID=A0A835IIJ9_9MAGN|nr:hypothetical protein IFM89_029602 [Coptis chinensis]